MAKSKCDGEAEQEPVSQKIIRNVFFSGLRAVLVWPIPLFLTPYIVTRIGIRDYGVWAVFAAITGLTSLGDLGVAGTLTKHVAEYYARDDRLALNRLVDTGLMLYIVLAFLFSGALGSASTLLTPFLFHGITFSHARVELLSLIFAGIIAVNILTVPFYSIVNGLQRMDVSNTFYSFNVLCGALLTVVLLSHGSGLEGLMLANLLSPLIVLVCYIWVVRRLVPALDLNPLQCRRSEVKHILVFGLQIYLTQIATAVHMQIDKLYLALFAGVEAAGFYNIAGDTAWKLRNVPAMLLNPIMAAASELDARDAREKLRELYFRSHKYMALFGVPLVVFVAMSSKSLVNLWLGPRLNVVAFPLAVLLVIDFFNLTTGPGYLIFMGSGVLRPGIRSAVIGVCLNLVLSLALIRYFGLSGAVWGTTVAVFIASVYFIYLFHHDTGYPLWDTVERAYLKPFLCSLASAWIIREFGGHLAQGWVDISLWAGLFGVVYFVGVTLTKFFDQFDLAKAESILPAIRFARRIIPVA
ncbi:MAG TPA: oligosaccharide flippase family protein [Terriglobia bacterium]|nr:oligosaccharide flippase family protein [Terriglobia bacterium]